MRKVTEQDVAECGVGKFIIEASELGIAPGAQYPERIETDLGNGHPFLPKRVRHDGTRIYQQEFGCIFLHVLND